MLKKLTVIANELDQRGLIKEADLLDSIIRSHVVAADTRDCIRWSETVDPEAIVNKTFEKIKTAWKNLNLDNINIDMTDIDRIALKKTKESNFLDQTKLEWSNESRGLCHAADWQLGGGSPTISCNWQMFRKHCFKSVDELASIIAHETAHIVMRQMVQQAMLFGKARSKTTGETVGGRLSDDNRENLSPELQRLINTSKGGSVDKTLFMQDSEHKADELGSILAQAAGYQFTMDAIHRIRSNQENDQFSQGYHPPTESRIGGSMSRVTPENVNDPKQP